MEKLGTIYKITNKKTGKSYIGQTVQRVERRWLAHCEQNQRSLKSYISNAIKKHGKDNFEFSVIKIVPVDQLNEYEWYYVKMFNTVYPHGYNLQEGGGSRGSMSEHSRLKMIESKKGKPALYLRGIPKSKEHKEKLRLAKLGKKLSPEHIKKSAMARVGKRLKPIIAESVDGKSVIYFKGIRIAEEFGFNRSGIHRALNGTRSQYKGYKFRYQEGT